MSQIENEKTLPQLDTRDLEDEELLLDRGFLLVIEGPLAGSVYPINQGATDLGRSQSCKITIDDRQISRAHLKFDNKSGQVVVEDLGSTNGSLINGEPLLRAMILEEGDQLQIGEHVFRFSLRNPVGLEKFGVLPHSYFDQRLHEEMDRAHRYKRPLSLAMIQIQDGQTPFKLQDFARIIEKVRKMIRTMDVVGHYGRNQLELMLPETDQADAVALGERIFKEVPSADRKAVFVGVASFPEDGGSIDLLVEKSREALKAAKTSNKGHVAHAKQDVRKVNMGNQEAIIKSKKMQELFSLAQRVAQSKITVLLLGETGVGKEVIAEAIHYHSQRKDDPMVCVNCAALTETLLESELFGHEKGAFTGADQTKIGLFETADGGTIFLDEVGEMPLKTQAKLLRVLQNKTFMRVGSNKEITSDVRVVAATNLKLDDLVEEGRFREDLFYRLNAATIEIPPLRERREEIPYLVDAFIEKVCQENGFERKHISSQALSLMHQYNWPGNIRELKNTVERSVIISEGDTIKPEDLANKISMAGLKPDSQHAAGDNGPQAQQIIPIDTEVGDMKEIVDGYEKQLIINALKKNSWNQTKAAQMLNVPRRTLVSKIKKYEIKEE